ncbi:hypothetical protein PFISCL1PPCAC_10116, partial [Pristionchus fissidentatus]
STVIVTHAMLRRTPHDAISHMVIVFVSYTIALGGVAMGSMKEKEGPMAAGMEKKRGCTFSSSAIENAIGMKTLPVAV